MTDAVRRSIPSVHEVVESVMTRSGRDAPARPLVVDAARGVLQAYRESLSRGHTPVTTETLVQLVVERARRDGEPPLVPVINATGIIVHTGLGRAPMPGPAVRAMADVAGRYAPVELEIESGRRGRRAAIVRGLLQRLTGAESATVVNNNAAALVLVLATVAAGRRVIVSRGELIEIGGSFRLPEIMAAGGAVLHEVGTTNRTRLNDYERAIGPDTAAVMKVHPSNFRLEGFRQEVTVDELSALGRAHGLTVIHDVGSGALRPLDHLGVASDEPVVAASIDDGADLVLFSGDKLLGGPQSGIIVGRGDLIERIEGHPLMRALRVDKVTLAGLGATLQLHLDPAATGRSVPVFALATTPVPVLQQRGDALAAEMAAWRGLAAVSVEASEAFLGGGSVPTESIPSRALVITAAGIGEDELLARLRRHRPGVIGRASAGAVWLDLRTVLPEQDAALLRAVRASVG